MKTGANVKHIKVGDRVVYGQSPLGAYSEIHNVPEEKLAILPDGISFETAAACFMKGLTAFYLLRKTYEVKARKSSCSTRLPVVSDKSPASGPKRWARR